MSDIFISYKREDQARAQRIRQTLQGLGFSVWWDRKILHGRVFDKVIREALTSASCVIVLWSKTSVESDWVKDEAQEGMQRDILIPVLIDRVAVPLGFGRLQTADLSNWGGERCHPEFVKLTRSVAAMLGHAVEETRYDLQVKPPDRRSALTENASSLWAMARQMRPRRSHRLRAAVLALAICGSAAAYVVHDTDCEPGSIPGMTPVVAQACRETRGVLRQAYGWAVEEARATTDPPIVGAGSPEAPFVDQIDIVAGDAVPEAEEVFREEEVPEPAEVAATVTARGVG